VLISIVTPVSFSFCPPWLRREGGESGPSHLSPPSDFHHFHHSGTAVPAAFGSAQTRPLFPTPPARYLSRVWPKIMLEQKGRIKENRGATEAPAIKILPLRISRRP
jgi:hypothetical protein